MVAMNIRQVIVKVKASTAKAMTSLQSFPTIDLDRIMATKDWLGTIARFTQEKNARLQERVIQVTEGAKQHATTVTDIVMPMQFQDSTWQRLEKAIATIQQIQTQVAEARQPPGTSTLESSGSEAGVDRQDARRHWQENLARGVPSSFFIVDAHGLMPVIRRVFLIESIVT